MDRELAKGYVGMVADDAGMFVSVGNNQYAHVRDSDHQFTYGSVLVGWQCGFEPMFVAVHSYLDVPLSDDEAEEIAMYGLEEMGWFAGEPTEPDYIVR